MDIIKVISMIAAAMFGAIAALTESKKDGRVTKWGKVALMGILVSTAFSLEIARREAKAEKKRSEVNESRYLAEVDRQRKIIDDVEVSLARQKENLDATRRNLDTSDKMAADLAKTATTQANLLGRADRLAKQMNISLLQQSDIRGDTARLRRPLRFSGLEATLEYDLANPTLGPWVKRVREYAESVLKREVSSSPQNKLGLQTNPSGTIERIQIPNGSGLFPDYRKPGEPEAYAALAYANIMVMVSQNGISDFGKGTELRYQAAVMVDTSHPRAFVAWVKPRPNFQASVDLEIDLISGKVRQKIFANRLSKEVDTGKITSFVDLTNKMLQVDLPYSDGRSLLPSLAELHFYEDQEFSKAYTLPVMKFTNNPKAKASLVYKIAESDFLDKPTSE